MIESFLSPVQSGFRFQVQEIWTGIKVRKRISKDWKSSHSLKAWARLETPKLRWRYEFLRVHIHELRYKHLPKKNHISAPAKSSFMRPTARSLSLLALTLVCAKFEWHWNFLHWWWLSVFGLNEWGEMRISKVDR